MKTHVVLLEMILTMSLALGVAIPTAQAQKPAGPNRPATVPDGFVITPFGYFHPSCVRGVDSEDTVLADGRVQHADGTVDANAPVCNYPHYTAGGETIAAGLKQPSITHSWIESANAINTTSSFGKLTAYWTVPPAPTMDDRQTVFLFPGMEDYNDVQTIIQPVLGWDAGFFGANWSIASWNCCPGGTTNHSTPLRVNSGDTIFGTIQSNSTTGTSHETWSITTEDITLGISTMLRKTPSEGQIFTWAQGGALEVYEIVQCSDYPPNNSVAFYDLALYDHNFNRYPNPGWGLFNYATGLTPQCSYGGKMGVKKVTLDY
jgi:hypothetical protein